MELCPVVIYDTTEGENKHRAQTDLHSWNSTTAPNVYNTVSGVAPREAPFRSIDLGEVALRSLPT